MCKAYQRSDIDFTEVNLLLSTVEVLEGLKSESGPNTSPFLSLHSQFWIPWVCAHFSIKVTLSGTVLSKGESLLQLVLSLSVL